MWSALEQSGAVTTVTVGGNNPSAETGSTLWGAGHFSARFVLRSLVGPIFPELLWPQQHRHVTFVLLLRCGFVILRFASLCWSSRGTVSLVCPGVPHMCLSTFFWPKNYTVNLFDAYLWPVNGTFLHCVVSAADFCIFNLRKGRSRFRFNWRHFPKQCITLRR